MNNGNGNADTGLVAAPQIVRCDDALLSRHWALIEEGLLIVKHKTDVAQRRAGLKQSQVTWTPQQIRFSVLKGLIGQNTVEMYLVFENEELAGFFVTSCPPDEFLQVPLVLHLWIAWSRKKGLLERCEPFLKELKRQRHCITIQHTSGRQGWLRRNPAGWKLSQLIYRCEVD